MTNPSSEAMAAAEKLVSAIQNDDNGIWELYVCGIFTETYFTERGARKDEQDVRVQIATALDTHTAALRAEVEALRAERDKYHEQVKMFQGAVLELLMVAEPDFSTKTFTVPFEEWDYLMSADRNAKDPNQKEIII